MNNLSAAYISHTGHWINTVIQNGVIRWSNAITDIQAGAYPFDRLLQDNLAYWADLTEWTVIPAASGYPPRTLEYVTSRDIDAIFPAIPARDPTVLAPRLVSFVEGSSNTVFPGPPERVLFYPSTNSVTLVLRLGAFDGNPALTAAQLPNGHWVGLLLQDLPDGTTMPIAIVHMVVEV